MSHQKFCKASIGKATNRRSMSHGSYPGFLLFFFPKGFFMAGVFWPPFLSHVFCKWLLSSRIIIIIFLQLALCTCMIFFLYFRFSERLNLSIIMCSFIGFFFQRNGHPSLTSMI